VNAISCTGMTIGMSCLPLVRLFPIRNVQQNTFDLMTSCSDIERLIACRSSTAKEALDLLVRKASETQRILDRYGASAGGDSRVSAKYQRVADNFAKVSAKIEGVLKRFHDSSSSEKRNDDKQMELLSQGISGVTQPRTYVHRSDYEYISSMEEGGRAHTLENLSKINKEINSIQDVYVSLSEVAVSQGSLLDSVNEKLGSAARSATSAVRELNRAQEKLDYWTKIKVYAVSGTAALGLILWLI
jgi:hypothetical protein